MPGALDANGIYIYAEDDDLSPFSTLLNKLADSTSDAIVAPGKVIQQVSATFSTQTTTTSTTFVPTGLSVSITPKRSDSKFIILAGSSFGVTVGKALFATIFRDSTNIGPANGMIVSSVEAAGFTQVVDLPATSSTITYSLRFRVLSGGTGTVANASALSTIQVLEVTA
jgi:hypothetical protein